MEFIRTCEDAFRYIQSKFQAELAQDLEASFQFIVEGGEPENWVLQIQDGICTILKDVQDFIDENLVATLKIAEQDFIKLITGELSGSTAYLQGKLKVDGNLQLTTQLGYLFVKN